MSGDCWLKGFIAGNRWLNIKEKLESLSEFCGVKIEYVRVEKHWLNQTVWYKVRGLESEIDAFKQLKREFFRENA